MRLKFTAAVAVSFIGWVGFGLPAVGFGQQEPAQNQQIPAPATQQPSLAEQQTPAPQSPAPDTPPPPKGKVLFERRTPQIDPEATPEEAPTQGVSSSRSDVLPEASKPQDETGPAFQVSDAERSAPTFIAYDLDAHLLPAKSRLVMHATFSVRNDGTSPLERLPIQVSSSLKWERFVLAGGAALTLPFVQHAINTDADHTGGAKEAIVTLPQPLAVGGVVTLSAFYAGDIAESSGRLERIGAPSNQAERADWDKVSTEGTWLRGFGNVLWYPTASAPVFLGDGAKLFQSVGLAKARQAEAKIRLRLAIEYEGEAPKWAYFCGRREPLTAVPEALNVPVASAPGVASAEFEEQTLGFRVPSLFIPDGSLRLADGPVLSILTESEDAVARYAKGEEQVQPLLAEWLGATPLAPLNIIDHTGQPFEDRTLLVASMAGVDAGGIAGVLMHSLSHAWFASSHIWLDEGTAQFMGWLWMEQNQGREFAEQQIRQQATGLALAEPSGKDAAVQSLIAARDEVYYRTKAASVLWMLRSVVGDAPLKAAFQTYRKSAKRDEDPKEFQRVLEAASHRDLNWLFDDWVYQDKGLPDLSIVSVSPRELTAKDGRGGFLVAVEVRNDGDAVAEIPVTVRAQGKSGALTTTERLRVKGRSSASTRILFEGNPAEVQVNDGSVPEIGNSVHLRQIVAAPKP